MSSESNMIVCLFCVTAGQNGENLGSDEEQIVQFVYLLYDLANNKVATIQQHLVRPITTHNDLISETVLTEECKIQTGLPEDAISNAQPLDHVLDEFERFLCSKEIHPDHGGKPFCFCTDGSLHLRMCLVPECVRKNIQLPSHFYRFFDLRKEFRKFYKSEGPVNCLKDMLTFLGIEGDQSVEYGIRHCQGMAAIINRLINDGGRFTEPEIIKDKLEAGVCTIDDMIKDDTIVRARGLPWQSSDQDVACFFRGLNIAGGGVALCLSQQGRRNGEALVRFESKEQRDLSLRRHKHHMGQRYIEVYKATGQDFLSVAGGSNSEAQEFLLRNTDNGSQIIIRMRGLPYTCKAEEVVDFFQQGLVSVEVLDGKDGILFVHQSDGRATGDAFVLFGSEEDANKALSKHRQSIGTRYIELFRSTTAEVQQVLNRSLEHLSLPSPESLTLHPLFPQFTTSPGFIIPRQHHLIMSGTQKDCIHIRALPFEASVADILTFLGEYSRHIVYQGVHLVYNSFGSPSGEAFIQMDSEKSAETTSATKNKKVFYMSQKKCFIEVIQCSGKDINLVLTNGLTSDPQQSLMQPSTGLQPLIHTTPLPPTTQLMLPPPPSHQNQFMMSSNQHHVISPDGTILTQGVGAPSPYPSPALYAYSAPPPSAHQATIHASGGPVDATTLLPVSSSTFGPGVHGGPRYTTIPAAPAGTFTASYQPVLYWYPSPPISPQNAFYIPSYSTTATVVMKGLPNNVHTRDIMRFLDGVTEVTPDVQLLKSSDGRGNGNEAYVNFSSRADAERVIKEQNQKQIGNRFVEMYMM